MSRFHAVITLAPLDDKWWETEGEFDYEIGRAGSGLIVHVPQGTRTDLATVPRALWPIVPPHLPQFAPAFVLHDYLCRWQGFERVIADAVLYDALRARGASIIKASLAYCAVSVWRIIRRK